jgi:hypothetical protein
MSPTQLKFISKEWEKLEAERSVTAQAIDIADATDEANRRWREIKLPTRVRLPSMSIEIGPVAVAGGQTPRRHSVVFDPAIGVTRAEMLDEMVRAPRGLLCKATRPFRVGSPDGIQFAVDEMVLALRPMPDISGSAAGMMDGVANGIRGAFPGSHVEKCAQQPGDLTFMWTNESARPAAQQPVAATHAFVASAENARGDADAAVVVDNDDYGLIGDDAGAAVVFDNDDYGLIGDDEADDFDEDDGVEGSAEVGDGGAQRAEERSDDGSVVMASKELQYETIEIGLDFDDGLELDLSVEGLSAEGAPAAISESDEYDDDDYDSMFAAALAIEDDMLPEDTPAKLESDLGDGVADPSGGAAPTATDESDTGLTNDGGEERIGRLRQRKPSWGRKPLASPPPLRRTRPTSREPDAADLEQYSSSARGWVKRSYKRQKDRRTGGVYDADSGPVLDDPQAVESALSAAAIIEIATAPEPIQTTSADPIQTTSAVATETAVAADAASAAPASTSTKSTKRKSADLLSRLKSTLTRNTSSRANHDGGPYEGRRLDFLHRCFKALETKGLDYEGVYRTAGQTSKVVALYNTYVVKRQEPDFDGSEVATLTSAVK